MPRPISVAPLLHLLLILSSRTSVLCNTARIRNACTILMARGNTSISAWFNCELWSGGCGCIAYGDWNGKDICVWKSFNDLYIHIIPYKMHCLHTFYIIWSSSKLNQILLNFHLVSQYIQIMERYVIHEKSS